MNQSNGGDVLFHFKGDDSNLSSKIKGVGKLIGGAIIAGTAVATTAVAGFVKSSSKNFSEFEQLAGGLEAMFQGNADQINKVTETSKNAYKDLQMSQNEYLQSFESSYAIVKNGLSDNADAIEYTNKVLQLSSDLFNTYGGSTEQYSNAINWALKGTFSYIDNLNLGIKGTQEGFVEAANKAGILGREISDVSELTSDEIVDVIQHYAEATGAWGRSQEEASKTVAGSLNMVKSSWQDLITEFGKKDGNIEGVFNNFMQSVEAFGSNIFPVIERIINNIIEYLPTVIDKIAQALPGVVQRILPPLIEAGVQVFQSLVQALPEFISILAEMLPTITTTLINGLADIINSLADSLPELIPILVDALFALFETLTSPEVLDKILDTAINLAVKLTEGIGNAIGDLCSDPEKLFSALIKVTIGLPGLLLLRLGQRLFPEIAEFTGKTISKITTELSKIKSKIITNVANWIGDMKKAGGNLIKGLWEGIGNLGQWVVNKIKGLGGSILKAVKGIFGIHSPSTEFAFIGRMNMEGLINGMEDLQPEIQKTIDDLFSLNPNVIGTMNTHFSPSVIVNNNVNVETDPLGQVVSNIKTFSGGAKNDYNYGMGG